MWRVGLATMVFASPLLVGCAAQNTEPIEMELTPGTPTQFSGSVVDYGNGEGPILCLGNIATSNPPQCGGVSLIGWDWDLIEHDVFSPPDPENSDEPTIRSGDYSFEGTPSANKQIDVVPESIEVVDFVVP